MHANIEFNQARVVGDLLLWQKDHEGNCTSHYFLDESLHRQGKITSNKSEQLGTVLRDVPGRPTIDMVAMLIGRMSDVAFRRRHEA